MIRPVAGGVRSDLQRLANGDDGHEAHHDAIGRCRTADRRRAGRHKRDGQRHLSDDPVTAARLWPKAEEAVSALFTGYSMIGG